MNSLVMTKTLKGVVPPIVTPFTNEGEIDDGLLREEIRYHVESDVSGIVVTGSTGEGNRLSYNEHEQIYEIAADVVDGDIPLVAGIIAWDTREAVEKASLAQTMGFDYLQVSPPPSYYRSQIPTADGLVNFYREVGEQCGVPIMIYDVMEHIDITTETVERIADVVPELHGVKVSSDFQTIASLQQSLGDELCIMSGLSQAQYPSYVLDIDGGIMGINAILPRVSVEIWEAVCNDNHDHARELFFATTPLVLSSMKKYGNNFPNGVKAAIDVLGRDPGRPRRPFQMPDSNVLERIEQSISYMRSQNVHEDPDTETL